MPKNNATGHHHMALRTRNIAETRRFYSDVLGMPLVATWVEENDLPGPGSNYIHCFFDVGDGSALAFFQFADDEQRPDPEVPQDPFEFHIALSATDVAAKEDLKNRLDSAGHLALEVDHGYCQSLYTQDPNGIIVEFVTEPDDIDTINAVSQERAYRLLENWLAGDRTVTSLRVDA